MKAGFYQFDIRAKDKSHNLVKIEDAFKAVEFDLMVLPELCTTGYLFSTKEEVSSLAEAVPEGESTKRLSDIARRKQGYIVAGLVEKEGDQLFNTAVVVGPEGYVGKQRKLHLPRFEAPLFDRGGELGLFDLNGVRIGIALCLDSWFPELCRHFALRGAQIICHPANFGGDMSLDVIRVRAMENMVFTITANRVGEETAGETVANFRGESRVIGCDGAILCQADENEIVLTTEIDPAEAYRKKNVFDMDLHQELQYYNSIISPPEQ